MCSFLAEHLLKWSPSHMATQELSQPLSFLIHVLVASVSEDIAARCSLGILVTGPGGFLNTVLLVEWLQVDLPPNRHLQAHSSFAP